MKQFIAPALLASGLLTHAFAEESGTNITSLVIFDEVVVTATGSEKQIFNTSLPVNLVEARDLDEKIITTMASVFENEPGVDAVTTGSGSVHPMIRGLDGERVLVLVNGVRMSEQRPGGNHVFSLDPAQIERVEVIRGPASVLYGSDAIGGVVNFITKGADEETGPETRFGGEAAVQYESAVEGWKESMHLRFGKGRFNGYVGGTYRDADNIETPDGELPNSFYEGGTAWAGGNYIGEGWKTYADYSFMLADIGIPGSTDFAEDYFDGEKHHNLRLGIAADQFSGSTEEVKVDFGWQRHNRNRYRLKTNNIPAALTGDLEVKIQLDIDTYTLKPQMIIAPNDTHRLTFGLDTFFETASSGRTLQDTGSTWVNPTYDGVPVIPDSTRAGIGLFAQDEMTLGERWIVTPGLRVDWIEAHTDGAEGHQLTDEQSSSSSAMSGSLGLLYKTSHTVNLYANAGRAFRAPTLLELYFYGPHDSLSDYGDPDLESETSWNFDFGVKTKGERLQAMAGVFYNMIDNYIAKELQDGGTGDDYYQYKNYADVSLYGAEAGLDYQVGGGFSTFASLSYVRGENENTDEPLPGIPPLKVRYGVRYNQTVSSQHWFWAELSGITAADQNRAGTGERETDGYTRGDVRMGLDFGETWSFIAAVENFADVTYEDHLSTYWQEQGSTDQPGRNIKLSAQARF